MHICIIKPSVVNTNFDIIWFMTSSFIHMMIQKNIPITKIWARIMMTYAILTIDFHSRSVRAIYDINDNYLPYDLCVQLHKHALFSGDIYYWSISLYQGQIIFTINVHTRRIHIWIQDYILLILIWANMVICNLNSWHCIFLFYFLMCWDQLSLQASYYIIEFHYSIVPYLAGFCYKMPT